MSKKVSLWAGVVLLILAGAALVIYNLSLLHRENNARAPQNAADPTGPKNLGESRPAGVRMIKPPSEIHMLDTHFGYGFSAGHPVAVTRDAGRSWYDVTPKDAGGAEGIVNGYFIDAGVGWAFDLRPAANMTVYGTRDGGRAWTRLADLPVKYGDGNMAAAFADARHGWFLEMTAGMGRHQGELFTTVDGGKTWAKVAETGSVGNLPFGGQLTAQKDGTLWLSGSQRADSSGGPGYLWLFRSGDGGRSWRQLQLPVPRAYSDYATAVSRPFFRGRDALISVLYSGGPAVVYASADSGRSWTARGETPPGNGPVFGDAMHGWQTDGHLLYRTQDGGLSWQPLPLDGIMREAAAAGFIARLDFTDARHGWAVLEDAPAAASFELMATVDGGETWRYSAKSP